MSESVITQCPHCSTSFRVNDAQLGAANGAVRCGTCLKVFNALQHQVGGASRANASS
ncbi:zinc-ribbon domain-containing protein, partial [Pseudomonas aeruginosa]|nr:zinc-ribbon domain-containing protein [Pseudomonas aeruginosa]